MPGTSSGSKLGRAMAILSLPLTPISKPALLLFKKQRRRRCQRYYNYAYVREYQFSPSNSSPLLSCPPPGVSTWRSRNKRRSSRARMILASLFCGGCSGFELDAAVLDGLQKPLPPPEDEDVVVVAAYGENNEGEDQEEEVWGDDEVDGRAERFIERFYEEMRMQRQSSLSRRRLLL